MARQYMTPPSIPEDIYCRLLRIPNSPEWVGTLTGALYPLCFPEAWTDEDGGITPDEAAARFTEIFNEMFLGTGGCEAMDCCPMRINPFNGRLQTSPDGGLTWFDVAEGPWTESLYPPFSAMPQPRPEATAAEKRCAAAATAAYVLHNLYTQTGNTLLNVVAATDWEYAGALGSMLTGFLMTIGAVATQPYVAIATLLGIVGVRQQYVDYPLDADDEERLMCILLENATLQPSEAVTFDFQAVWDAIDLDSPKNGLVRFLLTMIGPDALNYAGSIDAGLTPDCSPCTDEWCIEFDFTEDGYGGTSVRIVSGGSWCGSASGNPSWASGSGWTVVSNNRQVGIDFGTTISIKRAEMDVLVGSGTGSPRARLWFFEGPSYSADAGYSTGIVTTNDTGEITRGADLNILTNRVALARCTATGSTIFRRLRLYGDGEAPMIGEPCV